MSDIESVLSTLREYGLLDRARRVTAGDVTVELAAEVPVENQLAPTLREADARNEREAAERDEVMYGAAGLAVSELYG